MSAAVRFVLLGNDECFKDSELRGGHLFSIFAKFVARLSSHGRSSQVALPLHVCPQFVLLVTSHPHTIIPSHHHTIIPSHHHTIIPSYRHAITPTRFFSLSPAGCTHLAALLALLRRHVAYPAHVDATNTKSSRKVGDDTLQIVKTDDVVICGRMGSVRRRGRHGRSGCTAQKP